MLLPEAITIPLEEQLQEIAANNNVTVITNLGDYASNLVGLFLIVASLAALGYLIWGGLAWIMSGSDKNKLEEAKSRLTNAVIGLAIVATTWAVFLILDYFFGLGLVGGSSTSNRSSSSSNLPSGTTCLVPARRCCDTPGDSTCFCQRPAYQAQSHGSCTVGNSTGVYCECDPL